MNNFDRSLTEVLKEEGGWSNHPADPGGATNYGIIQRVYDAYRARVGMAPQTVKNISMMEVKTIYRDSYWNLGKCDQLPDGVDYVVFDGCVNSGVKQSIKWLQRAIGVADDGVIGPATITAAANYPNHDELVARICDLRLNFLRALKTWPTFGKGWGARVARVRQRGQAWAHGQVAPALMPAGNPAPMMARAYASDADMPPSAAIGDSATGAGTTGVILTQTINSLTPMSQIEIVAKVITWLTIVSALIAVGGIAYGIWARHRKAVVKDAIQAGP